MSSTLQCVTVEGVGKGYYWMATVGNQSTASVGPSSYGKPIIAAFDGVGSSLALTVGSQVRRRSRAVDLRCLALSPRVFIVRWSAIHVRLRCGVISDSPPRGCWFAVVQLVVLRGANMGPFGTVIDAYYTSGVNATSVVTASASVEATWGSSIPGVYLRAPAPPFPIHPL